MGIKWALTTYLLMTLVCGGGITDAALLTGGLEPVNFQHEAILDQMGNFVMLWTPLEKDIHIELQVATLGYIAIGFSPTGGMKGADIVLAWIDDQTGKLHIHDRFARGMFTPDIDDSQDIEGVGGYQNDSHTVVRFSRKWNTCDNNQDFKLSGDTMRVIWAYSEEDPKSEMDMRKHNFRGTKSIYLQEPRFKLPKFSEDVKIVDFLSSNVHLPDSQDTMYWCQIYQFPDLNSKHHMIGYVPIIQEGNHEHVHHIILNECHVNESSMHYEKWLQAGGRQCLVPNMPLSWHLCKHTIIAWAIGSEGEIYPEHVGMPLGEEYGGSNYYLMQIHYDNPNLKKGVVDNSGLRVYYTDKPREIDAGVLMVGHAVRFTMVIPPKQTWTTTAICSGRCTENSFPAGGIKVFQGLLHSHLLGRTIKMTQIREGRELPILFEDKNYDFNYQQQRVLKEEMIIQPGDTLIVQCKYDTANRKNPTFGGEGTQEEMCLLYLSYYPRANLSSCLSGPEMPYIYQPLGVKEIYQNAQNMSLFPDLYTIEAEEIKTRDEKVLNNPKSDYQDFDMSFALKKLTVKYPLQKQNRSLYDILHEVETWQDPKISEELQKQITFGTHKMRCTTVGGIEIEGSPKTTKYPDHIKIETLGDEECAADQMSEVYKTQDEKEQTLPITPAEKHKNNHKNHEIERAGASSVLPASFMLTFIYSAYQAFIA